MFENVALTLFGGFRQIPQQLANCCSKLFLQAAKGHSEIIFLSGFFSSWRSIKKLPKEDIFSLMLQRNCSYIETGN